MSKKLFALFGAPVSHSKSPLLHNSLFKKLCIDACYGRYHLENGAILKEKFFSLALDGANITVPFKEDAFHACDVVDEFASNIGAVNTIIPRDKKLYGYNTDAPGFIASLNGFSPKNALVLGAGGTARAISYALRAKGVDVVVANRSKERLVFFENAGFKTSLFDELDSNLRFNLMVNTTSAGLTNDETPCKEELLQALLTKSKLAYDCIYKETPFLKLANELCVDRKNGLDMLIWQAFFAFELFVDKKLDKKLVEVMKEAVRQ